MTYPLPAFLDAIVPDLEHLGALLESIGGTYRLMELYRGAEPTENEIAVIERVCLDEYGVTPRTMAHDHGGEHGAMLCDHCNPETP